MKIEIDPKKFDSIYDWLCDNVGYPYGGDGYLQCGEGWQIQCQYLDDVPWTVEVDFRRIPTTVQTEFLLRWS